MDISYNIVDILFMDTQNAETAVNVMRVGQSGIGFSHNGVNGPYESAWTIDGNFVADFITTGNLSASLIKSGTLDANLIDVQNLVSEKLVSTKETTEGVQSVEIQNSQIEMYKNGERVFHLWSPERSRESCSSILYMDETMFDGTHVGTCELSSMHFVLGGKGPYQAFCVDVDRNTGNIILDLNDERKVLFWKEDTDGTFVLAGRQE
jgi:hypothetical protein